MNIIRFNDVHKEYCSKNRDKKIALNGVDFSIEQGDIVGLIGLNGAGKSTTIKLLTGIMSHTSGSISVMGFDPYRDRKKLCKLYGVMFGQRSNLWWDLPLIDSLYIYGKIYNISREQIKKSISKYANDFNIDFINVPVRQLSFGQRVMGDILVSVIHNPKILFLDEATIALDVFNRKKVLEMVYNINNVSGTTIIMTSHILTDIETVCNRILLLDSGKKVFDGKLQSFLEKSSADKKVEVIIDNEEEKMRLLNEIKNMGLGNINLLNNKIIILCSSKYEEISKVMKMLDGSENSRRDYAVSNITLEDRLLYLME